MITPPRLPVVLVTGLSGGGRTSILHMLEDLGYEAVDNPPLIMLEDMVARGDRKLAIGVDARTRGFDPDLVLAALERLRLNQTLRPELVFVWADDDTLLRRFTETRRRHPLAPDGRITDGIKAERDMTMGLRAHADLVIDTTDLPLTALRRLIEQHYGPNTDSDGGRLVVSLLSFAYPRGLPREADLVFDGRFLRNPHYDPILRSRTGLDPEIAAYIAADPDHDEYLARIIGILDLLLPRFVLEGKKYATIAVGCTGGRHRSVHLIECLAAHLLTRIAADPPRDGAGAHWRLHVMHRELVADGYVKEQDRADRPDRPLHIADTPNGGSANHDKDDLGGDIRPPPRQAREA